MEKTVVLGAGNELMKDEGVGVHAIRALEAELPRLNSSVELIDIGTSPDFGHLIEGAGKIIIVDAVKGGYKPGTIYRFNADKIDSELKVTTSLHQMGILENLRMTELTGCGPRQTIIIGVEPADIEIGLELSQDIRTQMPKIIQTVLEEIGLTHCENEIMNETRV